MRWRRADKVQEIGALIVTGSSAAERLAAAMAGKSAYFQALVVAHGAGWAAVFAAPLEGETERVLPRIAAATPLYEAAKGWWFPVGTALDVPEHLLTALLAAFADHRRIVLPAIVVPRFSGEVASEADVYLVRDSVAFHDSALAA
jgi:hypothetical protein